MRKLLLLMALVLAMPTTAFAAPPPQPPGDIANVRLLSNSPQAVGVTGLNFMTYGVGRQARQVMVASGRFGLQTYDLSDPARPVLLDHLTSEELKLPGDTSGTFWQNEDIDVDHRRKLVFMARDPRAYAGSTSDPTKVSGVYIIDASNPDDLALRTFVDLPTGHTSSCINDCDFLWTGGPASSTAQQPEWPGGRPIIVTDIRDLDDITTSPVPVDLGRNDGRNAYAHDVQVDAAGIAWVSGLGGVRGYHTSGTHTDPVTGERREATATDPIPYAGGGFPASTTPSNFMHNSFRPVGPTLDDGPRPNAEYRPGSLIMATEEAFGSSTCDGVGMFNIASLEGSYDGQGWRSTPEDPFRLEVIGTWSPAHNEGTILNSFCSAHYFEAQDGIVAYSWYVQGTRFLDVTDPTNPIQIAYFRPDGGSSYAPYFHGEHIYIADIARGIDVVELTAGSARASAQRRDLAAPPIRPQQVAAADALAQRYGPDPDLGWACIIPRP